MRPLLIGEAPAATTPPGWPAFYGRERSAKRLWALGFRVSRSAQSAIGNVDAVNLLPHYPGPRWPMREAQRVAAVYLHDGMFDRHQVILVGRNAANAFSALDSWGWFEWFFLSDRDEKRGWPKFTVMPHPSGLNRWWNDRGNMERARAFADVLLKLPPPAAPRGLLPARSA